MRLIFAEGVARDPRRFQLPKRFKVVSEHLDIEGFYKTHAPTLNQPSSHSIIGFKPGNEPEEWPASEGKLPSRIS
jgi:hypothetical protein